jgi:hypothetical protein
LGLERRQGLRNPLAADQGETIPSKVLFCGAGQYPAGYRDTRQENSWKQMMGRQPLALIYAGCAVGSMQGLNRSVDIKSVLSPICRVKWCRDRRRTLRGRSRVEGGLGHTCPAQQTLGEQPGRLAALVVTAGWLCCVLWKGVLQHSMFEKITQERFF